MDDATYSNQVGVLVSQQFDLDNGADLCYNLIAAGVINAEMPLMSSARIVAQYLLQS